MKFRFLLWMLGRLLARASRSNPDFQRQLADKNLSFQLRTLDGKVARHFIVSNQRITSKAGLTAEPAFTLGFRDSAYAFAALTARNRQQAFMQGLQNQDIQIQGNPALVVWFQGLTQFLT